MVEIYTETLHQHEQLRLLYDRLQLIATSPPDALPQARLQRLLNRECDELTTRLNQHMQFEEEGGYMADVYRKRPGLTTTLDALLAEHAVFRTALEKLRLSAASPEANLGDLKVELGALLDRIAAHDTAESEILQTYLLQDLGTKD